MIQSRRTRPLVSVWVWVSRRRRREGKCKPGDGGCWGGRERARGLGDGAADETSIIRGATRTK